MKRLWGGLSFAFALGLGWSAYAQFFSPGQLAKPHASWSGEELSNCAKCHEENKGLSARRCLDCHTTLERRLVQRAGFHGHMPAAKRDLCQSCHPEHRGANFDLVKWQAEGGRDHFDHKQTGWPLAGKHATVPCDACHDKRLIVEPSSKRQVEQHLLTKTYLGLSTVCADCHFDEHRGQLGQLGHDCEKCHSEVSWKLSAPFDHQKPPYPLVGKHAPVPCGKCHPKVLDQATSATTFPKPRGARYLRLKPIEHKSCVNCHRDPHKGNLGASCSSCHSEADWKSIGDIPAAMPVSFHDKTKYPLQGGHVGVPCRSCHGPSPGQPVKYKGLPYQTCSACHSDAHLDQLRPQGRGEKPRDCATCHSLHAFRPAQYELEQHATLRFPLEGAHRAVACRLCHTDDSSLAARVPTDLRRSLKLQRRPERFSFMVMRPTKGPRQCDLCHQDVHLGQFASADRGNDCTRCHSVESFRQVAFDHDRDSRYALTGKHRQVKCNGCHTAEAPGKAVRYKPLPRDCAGCHRDVHGGQFLFPQPSRGEDHAIPDNTHCEHCHQTSGFKDLLFKHDKPAFAVYPLEGKHAEVKCGLCHQPVQIATGSPVARYRPLPSACDGCHVDPHRGASPCTECHAPTSWTNVRFSHDVETGFPLEDAHAKLSCRACHTRNFKEPVPNTCAGCHRDRHQSEFGTQCAGCHDQRSWQPLFQANAHRQSNFPLAGRHAGIPCQECHGQVRDRTFDRAALGCAACHRTNLDRAPSSTVNHATFASDCQRCHSTFAFSPAGFAGHETCFPITGSPHGGKRCASCHTVVPAGAAIGACATDTAACTNCHTHACAKSDRQHTQVLGYQCRDRKCYECHRDGNK